MPSAITGKLPVHCHNLPDLIKRIIFAPLILNFNLFKSIMYLKTFLLSLVLFINLGVQAQVKPIVIATDQTSMVLVVDGNGRLHQKYLGRKLLDEADYAALP